MTNKNKMCNPLKIHQKVPARLSTPED